uniref:Uncharacterized protein n=1 Tax=Salix viminalis TaxID=40686 RepID=A0A6N2LSN3_SALVM
MRDHLTAWLKDLKYAAEWHPTFTTKYMTPASLLGEPAMLKGGAVILHNPRKISLGCIAVDHDVNAMNSLVMLRDPYIGSSKGIQDLRKSAIRFDQQTGVSESVSIWKLRENVPCLMMLLLSIYWQMYRENNKKMKNHQETSCREIAR